MSAFVVSDKTIQQVVFAVLDAAAGNFGHGEYRMGRIRFHTDAIDKYYPREFGAFIADEKTIDKASQLGRKLSALNVAAVAYRYQDNEEALADMTNAEVRAAGHWFRFDETAGRCSLMQAYKSVSCLLYQCSEGEYDKTPLYRDLQRLSNDLAHDIAQRLPEWNSAEWDAA